MFPANIFTLRSKYEEEKEGEKEEDEEEEGEEEEGKRRRRRRSTHINFLMFKGVHPH